MAALKFCIFFTVLPWLISAELAMNVSFFKTRIQNQDHIHQYIGEESAGNYAWASIRYCSGQFLVGGCPHSELDLWYLLKHSDTHKAFFLQLDRRSVMKSEKMGEFLKIVGRESNFLGIPAVQGPGRSRVVDYDPMQPEFVQAKMRLALMFTEGLRGITGYTKAMLDEMRVYVTQYDNAIQIRRIYVVYDAFYLLQSFRDPQISIEDFDMYAGVIIYNMPKQKPVDDVDEFWRVVNQFTEKYEVVLLTTETMT